MTDISITIQPNGNGAVAIDGQPQPVQGETIEEARQQAMQHAISHARTAGQAATVTATDPTGTFHLTVQPDGTVTNRPAPDWEQDDASREGQDPVPIVTEVPHAQDTGDLDATRPRPVPTSQLATAPAHEGVMDTAPEPEPSASTTPDPLESDPRWIEMSRQPAEQGFRATLNNMGLKLTPAEAELDQRREQLRQQIAQEEQQRLIEEERARSEAAQESRRAARAREEAQRDKDRRSLIQTNYEEPKTVTVANHKGGVGKTTAIYCIGATAGRIRGGDVIAWDANETQGTLGFRAQKDRHTHSVVDLLEEAAEDFTTVRGSKRSTLMRYTRMQGDNQFGVVASDESSDRQDLVDGEAFAKVHEILARFHSFILIDTGNNHRVSHFKAALEATDQLVIPVSAGADGAHAAEAMMDNFEGLGYADLVKNAVVLLNDSATRRGDATGIAAKFKNRVRAIIPIPFDPALDSGDEIDFDTLQPATRAAYEEATAVVAQGLAVMPEARA